ncbi:hypothetical protein IAU60_001930 [Kwoniella sp. DSM 27419]
MDYSNLRTQLRTPGWMDDVEDNSELRRGLPVAHAIYGVPQTINTANYVYFLAMQELLGLRQGASEVETGTGASGKQDLVGLVTGMDLFWRDSLTCPTEQEYIDMVLGNHQSALTGSDYVPLVNLISVWFQIRDDYMNLHSSEYEANKGFAEDLTEGKFSFPVKRTQSYSLKHNTVVYLREHTKSLDYTKKVIITLQEQILEEIASLGGNGPLEKVVGALALSEE